MKTPLPSLESPNLQCHLIHMLCMAVRAGGDILETIETNFDISLVAASEHLDGDINASSSRTASWAGNIGFDRPQLTLTPYFPNTEPPGKTPLSDRTSEAGNSSSGNPDEALKLQRVPNPPSANGKSHLKRRHLPHVAFIISLKKRGKSTVQMISAHFQKASQMTPLLLNAWIPTKLMDTLLRILDRVNKCARQKADFLGFKQADKETTIERCHEEVQNNSLVWEVLV